MSWFDAYIDTHGGKLLVFLILGPIILGFPPLTGMINPLWSSLFGFPGRIAASGHPVYGPHPPYEGAAMLGWPLVLFGMMIWAAYRLLLSKHKWRNALVLAWAARACFVVPGGGSV